MDLLTAYPVVLNWDLPLLACAGNSKRPKRYFPFAEGPRNCVGQSLAKVSLVATMATLLQHFSFRLADEVHFRAWLNICSKHCPPLVLGKAPLLRHPWPGQP